MKTFHKTSLALLMAGMTVLLTSAATAQSASGASTSVGALENGSVSNTAQSETPNGGELKDLNVTTTSRTTDWAGLYGQIKASKKLTDGSNTFYSWSASQPANMKYVYASAGNAPSNSELSAVNDPNTVTGETTGADSANKTFTQSETFNGVGLSTSTPATANFGGSSASAFSTQLLQDTTGSPVYAANASAGSTGFNSESVDYQMLLSADGATSYDFYVELGSS